MTGEEEVFDVLIIGAGPAGLAVAARLRESTPSALFTDDEHQRYHWIKSHASRASIKHHKTGTVRAPKVQKQPMSSLSLLVLDRSDSNWLGHWRHCFRKFQISVLRSPMFFHVDPSDRDSLWGFGLCNGRLDECHEIPSCVGKEKSKHLKKKSKDCRRPLEPNINERDRNDYYRPSTRLFDDHTDAVINKYGLKGLVRREKVLDLEYAGRFTVRTDRNLYQARSVVLAIGPGNEPIIPGPPINAGACHVMDAKDFPHPSLPTTNANVLVVGGGLTSAQITDLAIRKGVTKVWHIMRSHLKVKHFDTDLNWIGKFRNLEQAVFWSADDDDQRLDMIKRARNGGSVTSEYQKKLQQHIKSGRLALFTNTTITSRMWNGKTWTIETNPPVALPPIDYIYFATGIQTNFETLPLLDKMRKRFPIEGKGGFPCLNDDLMWKDDIPLFVTGKLASLRIGPGAANLVGARTAAERVAWKLEEMFERNEQEYHEHYDERTEAFSGSQNRFSCLQT